MRVRVDARWIETARLLCLLEKRGSHNLRERTSLEESSKSRASTLQRDLQEAQDRVRPSLTVIILPFSRDRDPPPDLPAYARGPLRSTIGSGKR